MHPDTDRQYIRIKKTFIIVAILVLAAGIIGWSLGKSDNGQSSQTPQQSNTAPPITSTSNTNGVKSLVTYSLPDGWRETTCPSSPGSVYILPASAVAPNCDANPSTPVKLSVDPGNNRDCNQLQNPQNVKKHICISLFINGKKTLKSTTEYLSSSSFGKPVTVDAYYFDTGAEVVKLESFYNGENPFQREFDQLANSLNSK